LSWRSGSAAALRGLATRLAPAREGIHASV
jgi:hypothetical protein